MGMLLYMMEQQRKTAAASGAKKAPSKPTPIEKPEDKEVKEEPKEKEPEITRKDIMKMNVATVRAYAEKQGIKGANAMSGAELKRILGDRLVEETE